MAIQKEPGKPGSLKYAAAKLGVSLPMVYRLIEAGKVRSYHIGRAYRVSPESIADCIALLERESQGARGRKDLSASTLSGTSSANDGNLPTSRRSGGITSIGEAE